MATTLSTNLYAPDVWADLTAEQFQDKAIIATSSAVLTRDDLVGNPGEVIQFPKWNLLTDLDDLTEGVAMTTEELTQSSSMATIKEAGKAVEFSERHSLSASVTCRTRLSASSVSFRPARSTRTSLPPPPRPSRMGS